MQHVLLSSFIVHSVLEAETQEELTVQKGLHLHQEELKLGQHPISLRYLHRCKRRRIQLEVRGHSSLLLKVVLPIQWEKLHQPVHLLLADDQLQVKEVLLLQTEQDSLKRRVR